MLLPEEAKCGPIWLLLAKAPAERNATERSNVIRVVFISVSFNIHALNLKADWHPALEPVLNGWFIRRSF